MRDRFTDAPRRVPIGNPIGRRSWPANSGCESRVRALRGEQRRGARSPRCDLRTKRSPVLSALRIGTPVPGQELRLGLLRSGRASLVAVVKSANLWYGNDGAELWRVHGPRIRRVLGQ